MSPRKFITWATDEFILEIFFFAESFNSRRKTNLGRDWKTEKILLSAKLKKNNFEATEAKTPFKSFFWYETIFSDLF